MLPIDLGDLVAAVEVVGFEIAKHFALPHHVDNKDDGTPVTPIDILANQQLAGYAQHWNVAFIGEEGNGSLSGDYCLYVDPLDGTGAFVRGIPTFTVVVSLMRGGVTHMAVIHNPITRQTWAAARGEGTLYSIKNTPYIGLTIPHGSPSSWRTTICAWPGVDQPFANFQTRVLLDPKFSDQQMGAFAYGGGLIASGLIHATAISATSAVETAAMSLIVKEAGGVAMDLHGNPIDSFELGEHKGKADFLLPRGAIMACREEVAQTLVALYNQ
jgi:fructose-1,6-bisphosphatase/inositol monophosphatase family enzyme